MKTQPLIPRPDLSPLDTIDSIYRFLKQAQTLATILTDEQVEKWSAEKYSDTAWTIQGLIENSRVMIDLLWSQVRPLLNARANDFAGHALTLPEHMERLDYVTAALKEWIAAADRYPTLGDVDEIAAKVLPLMTDTRRGDQ